ncbi:MAG: glutaredoxin family protein [Gemmatimonadota bacterium]
MPLTLYTVPYCAYCERVKAELDRRKLAYEEVVVPFARWQREEVVRLTGQDQVPVLVDGDRVIHDSARILAHLQKARSA